MEEEELVLAGSVAGEDDLHDGAVLTPDVGGVDLLRLTEHLTDHLLLPHGGGEAEQDRLGGLGLPAVRPLYHHLLLEDEDLPADQVQGVRSVELEPGQACQEEEEDQEEEKELSSGLEVGDDESQQGGGA